MAAGFWLSASLGRHGANRCHRHSLPVDGIEAADRIAADQEIIGKPAQFVIAAPLAVRDLVSEEERSTSGSEAHSNGCGVKVTSTPPTVIVT